MDSQSIDYLNRFEALQKTNAGPIPWSLHFNSGKSGKHILFSGIVHGNEVGSLPALVKFMEGIQRGENSFVGTLTCVLGNVEAFRKNVRYVEADLNRVFFEGAKPTVESARARELMSVMQDVDLLIDFHQTSVECEEPFYIFPIEKTSYMWARAIAGSKVLVVHMPNERYMPDAVCFDEYVRALGRPSVTIELGKRGYTEIAEATALKMMSRTLELARLIEENKVTLESAAAAASELEFLRIVYREPYRDRVSRLREGFKNLSRVQQGEDLGEGEGFRYVATQTGRLLFPHYPKRDENGFAIGPFSEELFMLLAPICAEQLQLR